MFTHYQVWHLAPPTLPVPNELGCTRDGGRKCSQAWEECMIARAGCTHTCRQGVREVVVVPTGWWHATCNAGAPEATVGIGGQDCCDVLALYPFVFAKRPDLR